MMVIMLHLKKEAYSSVSNDIKAIETEYDGHRFRSRLEARWAIFFLSLIHISEPTRRS